MGIFDVEAVLSAVLGCTAVLQVVDHGPPDHESVRTDDERLVRGQKPIGASAFPCFGCMGVIRQFKTSH